LSSAQDIIYTLSTNVLGGLVSTSPPAQDGLKDIEAINRCFGKQHNELGGVLVALRAEKSSWANETLQALTRASPTSLAVVFRQLREGQSKASIADCLQMEYRIANGFMRPDGPSQDFFEGVRATLVDKDKQYKWNPPALEQVSEGIVQQFFEKLPTGGDLKL